jgi:hypothetical protein
MHTRMTPRGRAFVAALARFFATSLLVIAVAAVIIPVAHAIDRQFLRWRYRPIVPSVVAPVRNAPPKTFKPSFI